MIVMKFGGASLASPASIKQVASIVRSQLHRDPVVVVSALGDTTDHLLDILACAARAESYLAWKSQERLQHYHFCIAEDLLSGPELDAIDDYLRQIFRDLHVRMLEVCEGERSVTPELQDWILSLGEQLSSPIVSAALRTCGIPAAYLDARTLILTDEQFTNAEPRYWETYARIRWSAPLADRKQVVVLAGFIGASEDGRTTTLGRGGSDLTASLVGAALNAEQIQLWKDVDGLLTWDPRIRTGGYRIKYCSYPEMSELASAGATILHPNAIAPAQRLRIPVVIRNTFRPECEGTTIGVSRPDDAAIVKSIACRTNVTVLELRFPKASDGLQQSAPHLEEFFARRGAAANLLGMSGEVIYLSLENKLGASEFEFPVDHCMEIHARNHQTILTLVGNNLTNSSVAGRLPAVLASTQALILPSNTGCDAMHIAVPTVELAQYLQRIERAFFTEIDPQIFAESNSSNSETVDVEIGDPIAATPNAAGWRPVFPALRGSRA